MRVNSAFDAKYAVKKMNRWRALKKKRALKTEKIKEGALKTKKTAGAFAHPSFIWPSALRLTKIPIARMRTRD